MSFLKKIFGSSEKRTYLVIQDAYIECVQIEKGAEITGANRVDLEQGVVEKGAIKNTGLFQKALAALFSEADPHPVMSGPLFVSIPPEQVYSFLKVFPLHTKEDYCQSGLMEMVQAEAPFSADELVLDTDHVSILGHMAYGAAASLKSWRRLVENICQSLGFNIKAFIPEPVALAQLLPAEKPLSFAILSGVDSCLTLSLFFGGLLYDSFNLEPEADPAKEIQQTFNHFQAHFKTPIQSLYLTEVPPDLQKSFKTAFPDCPLDDLKPKEKFLSALSPALAGLVLFKKKDD